MKYLELNYLSLNSYLRFIKIPKNIHVMKT